MTTINMTNAKDIEIVCDNGGGITLMICEGDGLDTFVHNYNDAEQAARDIKDYLDEGTADGWDGHEPEFAIDTSTEEFAEHCRNGGYRDLSVKDLLDIDTDDESWFNVKQLAEAMQR